jgi:hypothetical protein
MDAVLDGGEYDVYTDDVWTELQNKVRLSESAVEERFQLLKGNQPIMQAYQRLSEGAEKWGRKDGLVMFRFGILPGAAIAVAALVAVNPLIAVVFGGITALNACRWAQSARGFTREGERLHSSLAIHLTLDRHYRELQKGHAHDIGKLGNERAGRLTVSDRDSGTQVIQSLVQVALADEAGSASPDLQSQTPDVVDQGVVSNDTSPPFA